MCGAAGLQECSPLKKKVCEFLIGSVGIFLDPVENDLP